MKSTVLLIFTVLVLCRHASSSADAVSESQALLSQKSLIIDDPQGCLSNWTAGTDPCAWSGVTCDNTARHVTALDLSGVNLTGTISPELSHLRFLQNLSLASNSIVGPIPSQLSLLANLRYLNLSNNILNGSFPSQFSLLRNIEVLDLYNNNMTGDLPVEITAMKRIRHLHLGGNYFSGKIPPEYGQWEFIEYLAVSGNELGGLVPPEIGNLSKLTELYIGYYNVFDGGLPPEIGNLTELLRLDAASCGLTGGIPPELGKLQKLDTLFLQVNGFSGAIPDEISDMKSLQSLDLSNNALEGEVPGKFSRLRNLTLLNLFRNKLHGNVPEFIGDLPALEVLQLWENNFTGSIPQGLGTNRRLTIVDLSSNKLTGVLPSSLCAGNRLQTFITLSNFLLGPIPDSLGKCVSLSRIRMGDNFFNGSIPAGIFTLPELTQLELQDNLLTGGFPVTGEKAAVNLGEISLSNNELSGELPPSIGNFSGVQKLLLDGNKFTGQIPGEISRLQQLSKVDFSNNRFSGNLTPEISQCNSLTFVDISRNNLTGDIPEAITSMKILNYLNLSRNHLVGDIPSSIANMQSLTSVDFSYNNLTGLVPTTGQFRSFNYTSFVGNPGLCGPYLGACEAGAVNKSHSHGGFSPSLKLLLVVVLLICSILFAIAAVLKARALKRASEARAWKLTAFQRLDFTVDDVLGCLKEEQIIGKGGAGIVYKGVMPNGDHVAVKRLAAIARGASHDHGFNAEIQTLGRIRHRHIVRLLGFCSNHETNLLVYEYMPNGSLGEVLHGRKGGHLHWDTRRKIALEASKGLCYLHHDCSPLIVHRDVKSNNILLDSNLEAHVADFGLAKFLQDSGASECMSAIAGSYGYIAPEYAYTLKVDEKSDVYSFGVVLLELITGKKPVGDFGDGVDIVQWVRKTTDSDKGRVLAVVDQRLLTVPMHEVAHVFHVAMMCVEEQAIDRPMMREVVQMLTDVPVSKVVDPLESPVSSRGATVEPNESPVSTPDLLSI